MSKFFSFSTIYGADGEHDTPYLTRLCIGRLRLHIFHRGDADEDHHNHPWNFWTFPLTTYVEDVAKNRPGSRYASYICERKVVKAFRLHFRPAEYTHRVIGKFHRYSEYGIPITLDDVMWGAKPQKIITLVWRGKGEQDWGFLKYRDKKWCWMDWKAYVFHNGKKAPCQDD